MVPIRHWETDEYPITIILDAGPVGGGAIIGQYNKEGLFNVTRFFSYKYGQAQSRYGQVKKELYNAVRVFKAVVLLITGERFVTITDCLPVIQMLKKMGEADATIMRYMIFLSQFDVEWKHIAGKKNVADVLSRWPWLMDDDDRYNDSDDEDDFCEQVVDKYVMKGLHVRGVVIPDAIPFDGDLYESTYYNIGLYLSTGEYPKVDGLKMADFRRECVGYGLMDGKLWKRPTKRHPIPRLVVCGDVNRFHVIKMVHEDYGVGHRGVKETYTKLAQTFYWPLMMDDVREVVKRCGRCQLCSSRQYIEPLHPMIVRTLFEVVSVDILELPKTELGYQYGIIGRCHFSYWPEADLLKRKRPQDWIRFLHREYVTRWGTRVFYSDNGELNCAEAKAWAKDNGLSLYFGATRHSLGHGLIERGHQPIINAMMAASEVAGSELEYVNVFFSTIYALRVTTLGWAGCSPYQLVTGEMPMMRWDEELTTFMDISSRVGNYSRDELLSKRIEVIAALPGKRADHEEKLVKSRAQMKAIYELKNQFKLRPKGEEIQVGDIVTVLDKARLSKPGGKINQRRMGPYRVIEKSEKGTFAIEELDGTRLRYYFHGNRLMPFFFWGDLEDVEFSVAVDLGETGVDEADSVRIASFSTFSSIDNKKLFIDYLTDVTLFPSRYYGDITNSMEMAGALAGESAAYKKRTFNNFDAFNILRTSRSSFAEAAKLGLFGNSALGGRLPLESKTTDITAETRLDTFHGESLRTQLVSLAEGNSHYYQEH